MNEMWKCIYHNGDIIYFAKVIQNEVIISDGHRVVRQYSMPGISGCSYNGEWLWISSEGSNLLTVVDNADRKSSVQLQIEGDVRILRAVSGQDSCIVVVIPGEEDTYAVLDCKRKEIIIRLPITVNCKPGSDTLDELFIQDGKNGRILCEYATWIPSRYMDEMDDRDILFYADLAWGECDTVATIQKRIHLNIDYENSDSADGNETLLADPGLKFPLFDCYLRHWLVQKSFSSSGKYIVYYCQDISGIVIGTSDGGDAYRIFKLPSEVAKDDNQFYYNDFKDILYVIDNDNNIKMYSVTCLNQKAIEELNIAYNNAYKKRQNLQRRRDAGDLSFWNIFNAAIDSCICIPRSHDQQGDNEEHTDCFVVTVESPIDGTIYYRGTKEMLVSFSEWNYRKDIMIPRFEGNLNLVFVFNSGKSEVSIILVENGTKTYSISIEDELTPEDIEHCCNRDLAREKLQKEPTNRYATTQLGYCGTVEDYNFLLAVFEDCYCKSVVHHGRSNGNVKASVDAITKLALKYYRKDAISALKNLLILANDNDLISAIKHNIVLLSEIYGPFVSDKPFRVDLQVKSFVDTAIHDEINELHLFHKAHTSTVYYLRTATGKLELRVEFAKKSILIECSAEYGNHHILDILDKGDTGIRVTYIAAGKVWKYFTFDNNNDNVILDRYMVGASEYVNLSVVPKKACIPAFVSSIGNGAFQGESVTEVIIPASVNTIGDEVFQYSELRSVLIPNNVSEIGVSAFANCRYLEEIVLPHKLNDISDSLLENSSIRNIEVPGNAERIGVRAFANCTLLESVVIQEGVEIIASGAFSGCKSLRSITIPASVTYIESKAFEMCDNIVIIGARGSYVEKYAAKNGFSFDGRLSTTPVNSQQEELQEVSKKLSELAERQARMEERQVQIGDTTQRIDGTTQGISQKISTLLLELQTWLKAEQNKFPVDSNDFYDEELISASVARSNNHINQCLSGDSLLDTEEKRLMILFGTVWERLLPSTQTSLKSAGVLWQYCIGINSPNFDYSGICISTTSALEGELRRWFFEGYQDYMVKRIGDPEIMPLSDVQKLWPKQLLDDKDGSYVLKNRESFTMGSLKYVFNESYYDSNAGKERWYIYDYLKTIVKPEFKKNPCIALNKFHDRNSFVSQCENIRASYRNRAAHPEIITRDEADNCYCQIVGRAEAYLQTTRIQGLILLLYSYLK